MIMKKIPCIICNSSKWEYIKPFLIEWHYNIKYVTSDWEKYPLLVINDADNFGVCSSYWRVCARNYNRELVNDIDEFLEKAAQLKGFTYKRKNIMKINGIEIKPGMVIVTENSEYVAFPTKNDISFANITYGGWRGTPDNIIMIRDLTENNILTEGKLLWEKPKEVIITMDEIAEKFGYPVEAIKIKK